MLLCVEIKLLQCGIMLRSGNMPNLVTELYSYTLVYNQNMLSSKVSKKYRKSIEK